MVDGSSPEPASQRDGSLRKPKSAHHWDGLRTLRNRIGDGDSSPAIIKCINGVDLRETLFPACVCASSRRVVERLLTSSLATASAVTDKISIAGIKF